MVETIRVISLSGLSCYVDPSLNYMYQRCHKKIAFIIVRRLRIKRDVLFPRAPAYYRRLCSLPERRSFLNGVMLIQRTRRAIEIILYIR